MVGYHKKDCTVNYLYVTGDMYSLMLIKRKTFEKNCKQAKIKT